MTKTQYDDIHEIIADTLDQLAEVANPLESGVALIAAGINEIRDSDDHADALTAYKELLTLMMKDIDNHSCAAGISIN